MADSTSCKNVGRGKQWARRGRRLILIAAAGAVCGFIIAPRDARAASAFWVAPGNAAYDDAASWSTGLIPNANDGTFFARGAGVSYTVFLNSPPALPPINYIADTLRVRSNNVTTNGFARASWTLDNPSTAPTTRGIIIGDLAADVASLNVAFLVQLSAGAMTVAQGTGSTATFTIGGGCTLSLTGIDGSNSELHVGANGTGTMNINSNALVSLPNSFSANTRIGGDSALGQGTINVTGGGVLNSAGLSVGSEGTGTLNVNTGGKVTSLGGSIGIGTATSTATVTGDGSEWTINGGLNLGLNGPATLNILAGGKVTSNNVVFAGGFDTSTVNVDGPGSQWSISGGALEFSGPGSTVTLTNGGMLTLNNGSIGTGTLTLNGGLLDAKNTTMSHSTQNYFAGTLRNLGSLGGANLIKTTGGTLFIDGTNQFSAGIGVFAGTVVFVTNHTSGAALGIADGAVARIETSATTPNNVVLRTPILEPNTTGKLDVRDNKAIFPGANIGSASGGVYNGVSGVVQRGHGTGTWNGTGGILTTMPDAATGLTSIGVATAQQTGYAGGMFGGVPVVGTDVLLMYTYAGDANLDGFISGDDYSAIDFASATPGASGWHNGDFNWDGIISGDDYSIIDFNLVAQGAPIPTGEVVQSATAVPEPGMGVLTLVAGLSAAARGRRRRRR